MKVKAATWALERDVSVVVADGFGDQTIRNIMRGKKVGTFFTVAEASPTSVEVQAVNGAAPSLNIIHNIIYTILLIISLDDWIFKNCLKSL